VGKRYSFARCSYAVIAAALLCLSQTPTEAACGKGVVLYQTYWRPFCRQVRALFARYHVRYKIVEISNNPPAIAYMDKRFGDPSVPRTVINGVVVAGYDEQRLRQLLCLD
jgi:glutaredoxin